jgi:SP family arabinose:H+ symporter-like MFS transporter
MFLKQPVSDIFAGGNNIYTFFKIQDKMGYVVFLAIVAAIGGFLFGYDTAVISGTIIQVSSQFGLNSIQEGWYVGCALVGSIIGVSVAGILSDFLGRKRTMIVSAMLFTVTGIGCALSNSFNGLVIYRIIGGVGIGVASIVSPIYISEISIARRRGTMVSFYQLAITIGFLGAYLVNFQLLKLAQQGAMENSALNKIFVGEVWRGMLGMETVPAVLFFIMIFVIPESPRWLILKHSPEKALKILKHIYRSDAEVNEQIAQTQQVIQSEKKSEWKHLSEPGILKAVLIGVAIAMLGQFMGVNAVLYYGPTIFVDSGLSSGDSLFYQVLVGLVNMLTTVIALIIIDKVGRKQLVYWGVSGMIISLLCIALYFASGESLGLTPVILLIFFLLYIFCCAISICAVIFVLLSEMYPMRVRGLAMSIAGFSLWIGTYLIGQLTPWLLENLRPAGTFILFALMCLPYMWIVWKKVPETTGKSLEEIEKMWI